MNNQKKEQLILKFANALETINSANSELDRFVLQNKVTAGRDFRRKFRTLRDSCKEIINAAQEYEKLIRNEKAGKENE